MICKMAAVAFVKKKRAQVHRDTRDIKIVLVSVSEILLTKKVICFTVKSDVCTTHTEITFKPSTFLLVNKVNSHDHLERVS